MWTPGRPPILTTNYAARRCRSHFSFLFLSLRVADVKINRAKRVSPREYHLRAPPSENKRWPHPSLLAQPLNALRTRQRLAHTQHNLFLSRLIAFLLFDLLIRERTPIYKSPGVDFYIEAEKRVRRERWVNPNRNWWCSQSINLSTFDFCVCTCNVIIIFTAPRLVKSTRAAFVYRIMRRCASHADCAARVIIYMRDRRWKRERDGSICMPLVCPA